MKNAYLIKLPFGMSLSCIKEDLKRLDGYWNMEKKGYCIPENAKERVERLLEENDLNAELINFSDSYYDKTPDQKKAYRIRTAIEVKEKQMYMNGDSVDPIELDKMKKLASYLERPQGYLAL